MGLRGPSHARLIPFTFGGRCASKIRRACQRLEIEREIVIALRGPLLYRRHNKMTRGFAGKLLAGLVLVVVLFIGGSSATYVVDPGHRGVQVTLGKVWPVAEPEGFGL